MVNSARSRDLVGQFRLLGGDVSFKPPSVRTLRTFVQQPSPPAEDECSICFSLSPRASARASLSAYGELCMVSTSMVVSCTRRQRECPVQLSGYFPHPSRFPPEGYVVRIRMVMYNTDVSPCCDAFYSCRLGDSPYRNGILRVFQTHRQPPLWSKDARLLVGCRGDRGSELPGIAGVGGWCWFP